MQARRDLVAIRKHGNINIIRSREQILRADLEDDDISLVAFVDEGAACNGRV